VPVRHPRKRARRTAHTLHEDATVTITAVRITPIAFRDPPLLNVVGIHERYALPSIVEVETADGLVGLGETYGDSAMIEGLQVVGDALIGLDPFDLAGLQARVRSPLRHALPLAGGGGDRGRRAALRVRRYRPGWTGALPRL